MAEFGKEQVLEAMHGRWAGFYGEYTELKKRGDELRGPCPLHGGKNPNFAVNSETGDWYCHSQCGRGGDAFSFLQERHAITFTEALARIAGIAGLAPSSSRNGQKAGSRIVMTYDYTDENGKLLFQVVRYEPKGFSQRRPNGAGGWLANLQGVRRVLYRLPEVVQAVAAGKTIYIPEGEKDVETLRSHGLVATCNPGGAGKWSAGYTKSLQDADVVIVPDNDEAGRSHAKTVAAALTGHARRVHILNLTGLPTKGDVTDWFAAGHTAQEFTALQPEDAVVPAIEPAAVEPAGDAPYVATDDGLVWNRHTGNGIVSTQLTNFTARIAAEVIEDNGAETARCYEIEANVGGRTRAFTIGARDFVPMAWPATYLGARALIFPGTTLKDHARAAIQLLSGDLTERHVYTHTGWRNIDGLWVYLHGGGCIPSDTGTATVDVRLPVVIRGFDLSTPPDSDTGIAEAVRGSLKLWDLGDVGIVVQIAAYRAVLGECDFSIYLTGPTGAFKSEIAALAQQHFGPSLDARHLPGAWSSTENALESMAFSLKDALFVIDDFCPVGGQTEVNRLNAKADRVLRGQGNNSGRTRLHADTSFRAPRPPRGLILSTGEDVATGHSLRSRMLIVEVEPGTIDSRRLSACQRTASDGVYAQALAAFIAYLASRYDEVGKNIANEVSRLRDNSGVRAEHLRTPTTIASLVLALEYLLDFAVSVQAIDSHERDMYRSRAMEAFNRFAAAQVEYQRDSDPARRFIELLRSVLVSGRAHISLPDGGCPPAAQNWGWRRNHGDDFSPDWRASGECIGWLEGGDIFLQPDASFTTVKRAADHSGNGIAITSKTLHKRLSEHGYLASTDPSRNTNTVRRTIGGVRREVLHLHVRFLNFGAHGRAETDQSDQDHALPADFEPQIAAGPSLPGGSADTFGQRLESGDDERERWRV